MCRKKELKKIYFKAVNAVLPKTIVKENIAKYKNKKVYICFYNNIFLFLNRYNLVYNFVHSPYYISTLNVYDLNLVKN